ncbi:MAG: c-type cytochrome [Xanthomonadales bacterium]|nr:c-type cytochrome [Gammaproteobacteria bacterium]MBT8054611.1 c-type cytochrome [Gammaproteobacteria bacterium]NND58113.1 c-type cytochrome [Xanthomonadales bacterium]NNK50386.1 c-type cytochrome [Xanthomonadales bacterium]
MRISGYILAALLIGLTANAAARELQGVISECEACHGPGGVSSDEDVPSLAGMGSQELLDSLEQFYFYERHCSTTTYRHGDRPKTPMNMCNVANTLSAEEKSTIAGYFADQ